MVGEQPRAARAADGAEPGHGTSEASRLLAAACHAQTRGHQNEEFRQQFGFLALMLVCGACMVYLMTVLRSILRPFLWALFLVMGARFFCRRGRRQLLPF
ncbi:unnamed protein product [Prorocentrum cordatum]|uniref:Glycerophosphocholine acyltransferase 1 n=1 Tax=Prorocentrum cordatum TaxID=2364126 RepID=A0ABN9UWC1_9DINO|nr:unnamed protein product [Polarella glacialis]